MSATRSDSNLGRPDTASVPLPTGPDPNIEELLAAELERMKRRRWERYPRVALAWLAALPEVTEQLAESIALPYNGFDSTRALLADLSSGGLLESAEVSAPDGTVSTTYWMSAAERAELGQFLRQEDPAAVWGAVADLIGRVGSTKEPDARTQPLQLWLDVAGSYGADLSGFALLRHIDRLLAAGNGAEALALVKAAQSLGSLVGDPLESAGRRAQWRIDRAFRQALDARALITYLPRTDVEGYIARFITDPRYWALHIVGDGGLGKTMTIRHLASGQLASQWHLGDLAVARIDFDHLDPRYPERRPAELLVALAQELEVYNDSRRAEQLAELFADSARAFHDRLSSGPITAQRAGLNTAIEVFADYVSALGRPVVLVIDTCEELAKLHTPNAESPAIESTFDILQRVHERAPATRAILAGRRWLVPRRSGATMIIGAPNLRPRAFMDVFEIDGFDPDQAQQYIELRDRDGRVPPELRRAVLDRAARGRHGESVPFDLACYIEWALAEPGLDPSFLQSAPGDPYVEQRILGRLRDADLREAIPLVVELGRFDADTLRHTLAGSGIDSARVFDGLAGQEWITTTAFTADGRPRALQVDDHLSARIRAAARADASRFGIDRTAVGHRLAQRILETPLDEVSVEMVEATVRMLPTVDAGAFWAGLVDCIVQQDAWAWAGQVTPRVAAAEAERAGQGPSILAAIRAVQAAAVIRSGTSDAVDLWLDVARHAHRHPDTDAGRRLATRAAAGQAASGDQRPLRTLAGTADADLPWVADSLLAAVNSSLCHGHYWPPRLQLLGRLLDRATDPTLRAGILLARSAENLLSGQLGAAEADARTALELAEVGPRSVAMLHWWPPPRFLDRIRCAIVQISRHRAAPPHEKQLTGWVTEAADHLDDPDAQALVAVALEQQLDWRDRVSIPADLPMHEAVAPIGDFWLLRARPLFVVAADAQVAAGDLHEAVDGVSRRRELAARSGDQAATLVECDAALARLSRELRIPLSTAIRDGKRSPDPAARSDAWVASALVEGIVPEDPAAAGGLHPWWRAQISPDAAQSGWASSILEVTTHPRPPQAFPMDQALYSDSEEIQSLRAPGRRDSATSESAPPLAPIPPSVALSDPAAAGGQFRAAALAGGDVAWVAGYLAPRAAALLALREAELMALRVPEAAMRLLHFSLRTSDSIDDRFGRLRAAVLIVLTADRTGLAERAMPADIVALITDAPWWLIDEESDPHASGWRERALRARLIRAGEPVPEPGGPAPELVGSRSSGRKWGSRRAPNEHLGESPAVVAESVHLRQRSLSLHVERGEITWSPCEILADDRVLSVRSARSRRQAQRRTWQRINPDLPRLTSTTGYLVVPLVLPSSSYSDDQDLERNICDAVRPTGLDPLMVRFLDRSGRSVQTAGVDGPLGWAGWPPQAPTMPSTYRGPSHLRAVTSDTSNLAIDRAFVTHLVGTPVPTATGWGFRVRSSSSPPSPSGSFTPGPASAGRPPSPNSLPMKPRPAASHRPLLIDDLVAEPAEILVLQMDPVDAPPEPLGKLRGGMTAVCLDVIASGLVGVVLTIPALPDFVAIEVAELVWALVRQARADPASARPDTLLDLAYHIRTVVARASVTFSNSDEQPWLDVMLYLRTAR